jgi:hypothetical protein
MGVQLYEARTAYMHQVVMGEPPEPGLELGHVDGKGLHNWRGNLRWLPRAGTIQASHDMLPYVVSSVILNATPVQRCHGEGTDGIFTTDALASGSPRMRFPSVWSERKLTKNCKTAVKLPNRSKPSKSDSSMISSGWGTRIRT